MAASVHIATHVVTSVRFAEGVGIVVDFGIGAMHFGADDAHRLVDQLREALRQQAAADARPLRRDEDEVRSAADVREEL